MKNSLAAAAKVLVGVAIWFGCNTFFGLGLKKYSDEAQQPSRLQGDIILVWGVALCSCAYTLPVLALAPRTGILRHWHANVAGPLALGAVAHAAGLAFTSYAFFSGSLQQVQVRWALLSWAHRRPSAALCSLCSCLPPCRVGCAPNPTHVV